MGDRDCAACDGTGRSPIHVTSIGMPKCFACNGTGLAEPGMSEASQRAVGALLAQAYESMGEAKPTVLTVSDMHCSSCGEPCGGQGHLVIDDLGSYKSCEEPERWQRQLKRAELRRDIRRALAERVSVGRSSDRYLIGGVARELLTRALNEMGGSRG